MQVHIVFGLDNGERFPHLVAVHAERSFAVAEAERFNYVEARVAQRHGTPVDCHYFVQSEDVIRPVSVEPKPQYKD